MDMCYPTEPTVKGTTLFEFYQPYDVSGTIACNSGSATMYFLFSNHLLYPFPLPVFGVDYSGNYSYTLYGPFTDLQAGAGQIQVGSAPVALSGDTTGLYIDSSIIQIGQKFILKLTFDDCSGNPKIICGNWKRGCHATVLDPCEDCLPAFTPGEKKFVVSAWVSEHHTNTKTTFTGPAIRITDNSTSTTYTFHASGQIIDGWQRIEGIFTGPTNGDMTLTFVGGSEDTYFDDIRIFPNDGSMMSYVYDPVTLRLVAELDERNYAKFYEYDEEGKLVRVKKETEQGIMTIQENRENSSLKPSEP